MSIIIFLFYLCLMIFFEEQKLQKAQGKSSLGSSSHDDLLPPPAPCVNANTTLTGSIYRARRGQDPICVNLSILETFYLPGSPPSRG